LGIYRTPSLIRNFANGYAAGRVFGDDDGTLVDFAKFASPRDAALDVATFGSTAQPRSRSIADPQPFIEAGKKKPKSNPTAAYRGSGHGKNCC
jgi:hypothetical protein